MKKLASLLVALLLLIGVATPATTAQAKSKKSNNIKVTYVLKKNKKQIAKKKITLKKNSSVMKGLKKGWKVSEKDGFITKIDGHKQNDKKKIYWTYTVNKKTVNVGANKKKLHNKDHVQFKLSKYEG
ncbi:DUF4430 domain-containing protein [Companilactobacillus versmoldensis]|uniref:Transcobalamin-like C-terminal domain-containing protein n=1 Tax=Companilactobacillus versmoldensis DSM 14857 = KCTC 3814 TaxID=1423815 RepID=A0A0R1SSS9_9LACO|nr:DUF4430 domain-containing protein [Companilactobacillus versmoldensis]KRL68267.1 hypothetical protein FC27_GL001009 [Companilactobacillus versmoldensis DSM 14857 = KCTC 3814]